MFFFRFLSRFSFKTLYRISDLLFFISYKIVRYRRNLVRKNLQRSFPQKTPQELKVIEKEFYTNLCDYSVESIKLLAIGKSHLAERMRFNHLNIIERYKSLNQSVIILSSHQFNWEWLLTSGSFSLPLPVDFVYQPVNNSFFDRYALFCRTRFGAHAVRRDEVGKELIRRKNVQRCIAIIADQYPGLGKDKKYLTTFLNQSTAFFLGASQIAALTQYPVVYAFVRKVGRGFYEATFEEIGRPPYTKDNTALQEAYVGAVERNIVEEPSGWLWSHKRWKKRHMEG
jgi:Kdo2-lipid IVA lauroyltransferase/acyltransferase